MYEQRVVFFLMVVMVKYNKGGLQSISDTHRRTLLGHKMTFLRVENMWIFGAKKWTADAQNCRIAAHINGNLGHPIGCLT